MYCIHVTILKCIFPHNFTIDKTWSSRNCHDVSQNVVTKQVSSNSHIDSYFPKKDSKTSRNVEHFKILTSEQSRKGCSSTSDILLLVCKRWQRLESQQPRKNLRRNFNPLRFYPIYIKGASEVLRRCLQQQGVRIVVFKFDTTLSHTWCDLKIHLNKTVLSIRFHVIVAKCITVKRCVKE